MNKRAKEIYSDQDYIEGLRQRRNVIISAIYRNYIDCIINLVNRNSGTDEDAEDLFQDALIIIYKRIRNEELKLSCSFKTFFYSVCRNLWLQRLNKRQRNTIRITDTEEYSDLSADIDYEIVEPSEERKRIYLRHFSSLSPDCQRILELFAQGFNVNEIAEQMQYKSDDYAKARKYQCKELLKARIKNDPLYKALADDEEK